VVKASGSCRATWYRPWFETLRLHFFRHRNKICAVSKKFFFGENRLLFIYLCSKKSHCEVGLVNSSKRDWSNGWIKPKRLFKLADSRKKENPQKRARIDQHADSDDDRES
jgi:hypothetical protein